MFITIERQCLAVETQNEEGGLEKYELLFQEKAF